MAPAEALGRLKLFRFPVSLGLGTLVIDIMARVWSDFDMEFVHVFEGALFLLASMVLLVASRFDQKASDTVFRVDVWLALAIGLGGIRSALWAGGMDPFDSNSITFVLGVIAAPIIFFLLQKRPSPAKPPLRPVPAKGKQKIGNQKIEKHTTDQSQSGKA